MGCLLRESGFCCFLNSVSDLPSGSTCQFTFASLNSEEASNVPELNTAQQHRRPLTLRSHIPSLPLYLFCPFSFSSDYVSLGSTCSHSSQVPLSGAPSKMFHQLTMGWTVLLKQPSCSCLIHQSHGRLNDGLVCYGVCACPQGEHCLLATFNSLLTLFSTIR